MLRLKWKPGSAAKCVGPYYVSTTRFTYRSYWSMPLVYWHALQLRRNWGKIDGAVGLSVMSDFRTRTTYTVSIWQDINDLQNWLHSAAHAPLMKSFRPRMLSSAIDGWTSDTFDLGSAWREALKRVGLR